MHVGLRAGERARRAAWASEAVSRARRWLRRGGGFALAAAVVAAGPGATAATRRQVPALDDPFEAGTLLLRIFRDSDGLPQNTIHAIARDSRGYLWVGTQDGAAYYDGRACTTVNMSDRTHANFVRAIARGARGDLWFGTIGGLYRRTGDSWRPVAGYPLDLVHQRINAVIETGTATEPVLWVGTHSLGVWRG